MDPNTASGLLLIALSVAMFALARIFHVLDRRATHREPRAVVPLHGAGLIYVCPVCRQTVAEIHDDPAQFVAALLNPHHTCATCTASLAELDRELTTGGAS